MGSAKGKRPLLANEIRLLDGQADISAFDLPSTPTPIEKLVERLQFQNPRGAVEFLRANPSILGQERLLTHLNDQLQ